jgi:hypothetical protein
MTYSIDHLFIGLSVCGQMFEGFKPDQRRENHKPKGGRSVLHWKILYSVLANLSQKGKAEI